MKNIQLAALAALVTLSSSCMTTYDAYGNTRQAVDPGVAIAGVAAAGLVGYAIANNHHDNNNYYRGNSYQGGGGYYRGGGYYGGGYQSYDPCY